MEYKVIYPFEVFEKIQNGCTVGLTDRMNGVVLYVGELTVAELSDVLKTYDSINGRYEFWVKEELEETNETV